MFMYYIGMYRRYPCTKRFQFKKTPTSPRDACCQWNDHPRPAVVFGLHDLIGVLEKENKQICQTVYSTY